MRDDVRFILPKDLHETLRTIAAGLRAGRVLQPDLNTVIAFLGALPPDTIVRSASEIAEAAGLDHRTSPLRMLPWWQPRPPSDHDLLRDMPALAYLFLFHRDGRLREAALKSFDDGLGSPFFFTAIAYRLNDWADVVRAAAVSCAERVFPKTNATVIAAAGIYLLKQRRDWKRWGSESAVLETALFRPDVADCLANTFRTARSGPMGTLLRRASQSPAMDRHLDSLSTDAFLPSVRAVALRSLIEGCINWPIGHERQWIDKRYGLYRRVPVFDQREISRPRELEALIGQGANDRSAAVRKVSAAGLLQHHKSLSDPDGIIARLTTDRSSAVRERIAFILKERSRQHS